jgi:hypothetical protein
MRSIRVCLSYVFAAAVLLCGALPAWGQGVTTGAINGLVLDAAGKPVGGATVNIVHEPSGTRASAVTQPDGQYSVTGLRIGGPYSVTVAGDGVAPQTRSSVFTELGVSTNVSFSGEDVVQLETFRVEEANDTIFGTEKMGVSSSFGDQDIDNLSTVRNSVQDLARLDSRFYLGSLDQGGQLSAQGQNFRFNTFLIDGVAAGDPFGLNSNGFSSLFSPVPLEALEAVSIELNPYDVRYAGFTGAVINAIIKSGTNRYSGSVYYQFTNDELRSDNPLSGAKEPFDEKNYGITFNGPLIKDRLFFSLSYDKFKRETVVPSSNFIPDAAGLAAIEQIIEKARSYGYDPGSLSGPSSNISEQETIIGKLDWNISAQHRLTATYRSNEGVNTSFANYTASTATYTSLSNHWFDQPRDTKSYTAQLYSQWTPDFRTEATVSYTEYDGTPANRGDAFPMVRIYGISGTRLDTGAAVPSGSIYLGTENSRQLNLITTEEKQARFSGEYSFGNHTLTVGTEGTFTEYNNAFVQNTMGNYEFSNAAAWIAGGPPVRYQVQRPYAGNTIEDAIARFSYDAYAGFIQDTWRPSANLTILAGLRFDYPYIGEKPPVAAGFSAAGFTSESGRAITRNDTTNSGNSTLAPRIGFAYTLPTERRTQVRGGVGLFQGKNPAVWISNAYSNAGSVYNYVASSAELATTVFNPDPNTQTSGSANPAPNINITDPDFKQPSLWKSNLAVDHDLPFGSIIASAEVYYNQVADGVQTEFLNYRRATDGNGSGLAPDGRQRFGTATSIVSSTSYATAGRRRVSNFADVFYLTNTSKGEAYGLTLSLTRPVINKWGWSASWTRGNATEVSPATSSTAFSNYQNRAVFNPNEDVASISNTNIRDNIVLTLSREFEFFKKAPTTVTFAYIARSGRPYSWVFYGDANGDGFGFNDLLYVPTGPDDSRVEWASTAERDAFFAFVESSTLKDYKGGNPGRNSEKSPWLQTVDMKVTQEIPLFRSVRAQLFANVINLANLFDQDWGIQEEVPFSFRRAVAGATFRPASNNGAGAWAYTFNGTTLNGVPVTADDTPISRWQVQLGMKILF